MIEEVTTYLADDDGDKVVSARERRVFNAEVLVASAGFILAITLAAINAFYATRGSVVVVQPPEQLTLYRDGEGDRAVLTIAVRLAMINAADSQHGDVMMDASLSPIVGGPKFRYGGTVKPVFTDRADADKCDVGARCIVLPGFLAIEQTDEIIDVPGGTVRGTYLYYPVAEWNCVAAKAKSAAGCPQFANFEATMKTLGAKPLTVTIDIDLFQDGARRITCTAPEINVAYLRKQGWTTMSCGNAKVTGAPWF
mgnify:CR=1 FL=1